MSYPETPLTRQEMYLDAIARGETDGIPAVPNTRLEMYLDYIARNGGGGGGGEPAAYIKNAAVSGNKLTLTKKNGSTVVFNMTSVVNTINSAIAALETSVTGGLKSLNNLRAAGLVNEIEDETAAYIKPVPNGASPEAVINSVSGRTLNWNQRLHPLTIDYSTDDWAITSDASGKVTLVVNAAHDFTDDYQNITALDGSEFVSGHKYFLKDGGNTVHLYLKTYDTAMDTVITVATAQYNNVRMWGSVPAAGTYYLYPQIFDLTEMFGAGNEPTADECAVMFSQDYYPYSEPTETTYTPVAVISGDTTYPIGTLPMKVNVAPNGTLTFVSDHTDVHVALPSSVSFATSQIGDLNALETEAKDNLVNAINEVAAAGATDHETWTFTLDDETTVTKEVMLWTGAE